MSYFTGKFTRFDFGWSCAPEPAEGAYSVSPVAVARFKRIHF